MGIREVNERKGFKEYAAAGVRFYVKKDTKDPAKFIIAEFRKNSCGYSLAETTLDIHDFNYDEEHVFPKGRSRSNYINALKIYCQLGTNHLKGIVINYDDIQDVKEHIYNRFVLDEASRFITQSND